MVPDPSASAADSPVPPSFVDLPRLVFDRAGIQAVDREAIEVFGIPGVVLMENAARGLALRLLRHLDGFGGSPSVLICCGPGNNGGDGYAAARHLHNRGVRCLLARLGDPREGSDARTNAKICEAMGIPTLEVGELPATPTVDLIVDALLGTGLDRPVEGRAAEWIDWINARPEPIVAVDVPSGLDCNSGEPLGTAVEASETVTFVGWKVGFLQPDAVRYLGDVTVADIGAPVDLYRRHALDRPIG